MQHKSAPSRYIQLSTHVSCTFGGRVTVRNGGLSSSVTHGCLRITLLRLSAAWRAKGKNWVLAQLWHIGSLRVWETLQPGNTCVNQVQKSRIFSNVLGEIACWWLCSTQQNIFYFLSDNELHFLLSRMIRSTSEFATITMKLYCCSIGVSVRARVFSYWNTSGLLGCDDIQLCGEMEKLPECNLPAPAFRGSSYPFYTSVHSFYRSKFYYLRYSMCHRLHPRGVMHTLKNSYTPGPLSGSVLHQSTLSSVSFCSRIWCTLQ